MVNVAVIGLGAMGYNHVRVLAAMDKVVLVSVCDADQALAKSIAEKFRVKSFYLDYRELLKKEKPDAVIIAVPTKFHKEVTVGCLAAGVHVFVEKPIADSVEDAQEMIDLAKKQKKLLMVGHVERFNPAVTKIKELLDKGALGDIYLVNTVRAGPTPKRLLGKREGVLVDLAVHDVDIISYLVGDIREVFSHLIMSGQQEIYARAMFKLDAGMLGSSEFSWVSPNRKRDIQIYGVKGTIEGNYMDQNVWFYENGEDLTNFDPRNYYKTVLLGGCIQEGRVIKYPVRKQEPLQIELAHFMDCVVNNKQPMITPEAAKRALAVALAILDSGKSGNTVAVRK